jgi:hypothetical protein
MTTEIKNELVDCLSDCAIKGLHANRLKWDSLLLELNRPPIIDALRSRIQTSDIGRLQCMATDKRKAVSALGISLFREVQDDPKVRKFLFDLWQKKGASYHRRWWVMFRLLDYPDLSMKFHRELFQFVTANWKPWLADQASNFGGAENLLKVLESRLKNPSWKKSRTWERVLSSLGASDDKFLAEFLEWIRTNRLGAPLVKEALAFAAKQRPGAFKIHRVSRPPVAKSTR